MKTSRRRLWLCGCLGWCVAAVIFFPVFWLALTALKTEHDAYQPELWFQPTLQSFRDVFARAHYAGFALNSIYVSLGSTLMCFLLAIPAAYRMAFFPSGRTQSLLIWMLSTRMMPAVGVLLPVYLIFRSAALLDSIIGLVLVNALMNLPIAVWMAYTFFCEIPPAILEAARVDGAGTSRAIRYVIAPLALPGLSSTALLLVVLSWNESFWSLNLTSAKAAPLAVFIASFSSPEGLFWAKLSAASLLAIAPVMALGWLTQKQLVAGLTFGAVK